MNTLSLILYFAGVVGSLGAVVGFWIGLLAFATVFSGIAWGYTADQCRSDERKVAEHKNRFFKVLKIFVVTGVIFSVLSVVVPSERTVYLIAASEMGEEVIQSEEMKEMYNDLRLVIKSYIKEDKE